MQAHLLESIVAASLDAIVCADEEGKITLWNEAADDISVALTHIAREKERRQMDTELRRRVEELERFQRATVRREFRIKELRDELEELKKGAADSKK